ncbi:MAG: RnfABCDGE type electron transport complex subunit D [Thiobacillaceae bacterium]|nr:RnfABCDGE type electron transport complex subunit D [Thiobacillaceae bacterium]
MPTSPHIVLADNSVRAVMFKVLAALVPGVMVHAWMFGPAIWVSLLLTTLFCLVIEALVLAMRDRPLKPFLSDGSVLVTAWLLALSLPTLLPWWLYALGSLFAVLVAKHLYGGLGQNVFNPAMVGYAVLIVSFPAHMNLWPAPVGVAGHTPNLMEALDLVFAGQGAVSPDAYTAATPMDQLRAQVRTGLSAEAVAAASFGLHAKEALVLSYALGGLLLLAHRVITWHIPVAFLGALVATATLLHLIDPGRHADPLFHLLTGSTVLGAFFILTDPVSASTTPLGKLIYAGLAGVITVLIRSFGAYPDGVAFAVLLMNAAVPFIDAYTQPRVFGHSRGRRT